MLGYCVVLSFFLVLLNCGRGNSQISVETNPQMGKFFSPKGVECMWLHSKSDKTELSLMVACWCNNTDGEKKDYGCNYKTTRKLCKKSSDSFFEGIMDQLKGNFHSNQDGIKLSVKCFNLSSSLQLMKTLAFQ